MSRSRQRLEAMLHVTELRAIGAKLAESRAVAAQRDLDRAGEKLDAHVQQLELAVAGWQASLSHGSFDPVAASFWGQAVNAGEASALQAKRDKTDCEHADATARSAFGRATADDRCARDLLKRARSHRAIEILRRQDDERADHATRSFVRS